MKKFIFLHYGFEKLMPEIMKAWEDWFSSIKGNIIDRGGISAMVEKSQKLV